MNRLLSILLVGLLQVSLVVASTYNLKVEVMPNGAGSLNTSGGSYEEGSSIRLYTSNYTGFVFLGWYDGETLLSSSKSFYYSMPAKDVTVQAKYEYNPSVPGNPAMPDTATLYRFSASISPDGAGSLNTTSDKYSAGTSISLRAYNNTGFVFNGWQDEKGEIISSNSSFSYKMPAKDSHLTAMYTYDPSVPANPDSMPIRYTLNIQCKPVGSGSFNTNSISVGEGENTRLYAYTNTGFKFLRWEDKDGTPLSSEQNFYYVMPHGNHTIYGVFEYDPEPPTNPNKNYWNKETGEVIVDDFTPNSLYSAISNAIGGSSRDDVSMIIVAGKMGDNDFGIANNFSKCSLLDLSRTTGVTEIPSYAFDYTNLESVYLPATVEKIGYRAFADCSQLLSLTVYAMTPPVLDSYVFDGVQEGLVVYVPAGAIPQYQETEGWKNFTLLPIQEDIRNLTVNLPAGTNVADYAQMWLELTNTKNGQRIHYVMTDKTAYTFMNIIRNTSWNITLCNQSGDVFGKIDNVEVKDEDVTVTFASLTQPKSVNLSVKTPDGQDVTQQTQITWTNAEGKYLSQGCSLTGLPVGYQTKYKVILSEQLAMLYNVPAEAEYTLTATDNNPVCQLTAIGQVKVSGKVVDKKTNQPVNGAVISASQTFGGKYSKTFSCKTDNKGEYSIDLYKVPSSIAFSAADYVSQTLGCDSIVDASGALAMQDVALKEIAGAVISLSLTYTPCAEDGETAEVQNWFNDYNNVGYTLYNKTKNRTISQFNVQYPQIVLLEEVADGDELLLTATSKTGAFMPVQENVVIAEQAAEATVNIFELGKIDAAFSKNINSSVKGILYDGNGKLVKSYDYAQASLSIGNLTDGSYTLVSMGDSKLFSSIYDLSQFSQAGLTEGTDYVKNTVAVQSGKISKISIEEIPTFNESKLYYTGENTSFTVNKSSIVAGNYLTLSGRIDFKPAYVSSVSNIQMVVDLPENCSFVENSVMVGNNTSSYTLNGTRLTIPVARLNDRIRFCVIPTLGGDYAPSAFAQFDMNGETITQPIGSANYTAKDLSIIVPSTVAKTTVPVSGTAIGKCDIEIYDNGMLVGQTTSLANGTWATSVELNEPYNLSKHQIYAKVTTKTGVELLSETHVCAYDMNAIQVMKVTMYHYNPEMNKTFESIFDFQNPKTTPTQWTVYYPNKKFTYTIEFTNNSPEKVSNVILYVHTADGQIVPLHPKYDENRDLWVADIDMGSSSNGYYPVNCSVDFDYVSELHVNQEMLDDTYNTGLDLNSDVTQNIATYKEFIQSLDEFSGDNNELLTLVNTFDDQIGFSYSNEIEEKEIRQEIEKIQAMSKEEQISYIASLGSDLVSEYNKIIDEDFLKNFDGINGSSTIVVDGIEYVITQSDASLFDAEHAEENGFTKIAANNFSVYTRATDSPMSYEMVDITHNVYIKLIPTSEKAVILKAKVIGLDATDVMFDAAIEALETASETLGKAVNLVMDLVEMAGDLVDNLTKGLDKDIKIAEIAAKYAYEEGILEGEMSSYHMWAKRAAELKTKKANLFKWLDKVKGFKATTLTKKANLLLNVKSLITDVHNWWSLYKKIKGKIPCEAAPQKAEQLFSDVKYYGGLVCTLDVLNLTSSCMALYSAVVAAAGAVETAGSSLVIGGAAALTLQGVSIIAGLVGDYMSNRMYKQLKSDVDKLNCRTDCGQPGQSPCPGDGDGNSGSGGGNGSGAPNDNVQIDPSGYVYEAVAANRLEGVTSTIFYKENVEDMYGDLHENIVKWDAAEYAQENPLFTDENGMYRWDVPQGLWQVKFEKEGYETTYSEWLPVPPPQLDVNIAMKQNMQPVVKNARAFEDAVEVEFDKYMMPELLNTDNILVMADGKALEGKVELLNEEVSYEGNTDTYASKIRFNAVNPFPAKDVTLLVKNQVKSYAGIRMQEDYQQDFTVEQEVRKIACDSLTTVIYGETAEVTVSVLPAAASAGKTLNVKALSNIIISVDEQQLTLDEDGKASFLVKGELPGTSALTFSVDGYDVSATTIVSVETESSIVTAMPKASIASGSEVGKDTEVYLSCDTEGATIYYTSDGSCPCDETGSRKVYDGEPIIISQSVTIKAMAVVKGKTESDVAEFVYTVVGDGIDDVTVNGKIHIYPLPVRDKLNVVAGGKTIKSVTISSLNGVQVAESNTAATAVTLNVGNIAAGIYIVNVKTENGNYNRKIVKL